MGSIARPGSPPDWWRRYTPADLVHVTVPVLGGVRLTRPAVQLPSEPPGVEAHEVGAASAQVLQVRREGRADGHVVHGDHVRWALPGDRRYLKTLLIELRLQPDRVSGENRAKGVLQI